MSAGLGAAALSPRLSALVLGPDSLPVLDTRHLRKPVQPVMRILKLPAYYEDFVLLPVLVMMMS